MIETNRYVSAHSASGRRLRVNRIDPHRDPRWQDFVRAHPHGTIYHDSAWIKLLEQEHSQEAEHLACENDDGELLAILPLLRTEGLPFGLGGPRVGRRLSSLPRTPVAGPLSNREAATEAILRHAKSRARQYPGTLLEIKSQGPHPEGVVDALVLTPWRNSYVLELPRDPA